MSLRSGDLETLTDTQVKREGVATAEAPRDVAGGEAGVTARRSPVEIAVWLLVALTFAPVIVELSREWATDERYSHGWLILPISAGLLWLRKGQLAAVPRSGSWFGVLLIIAGLCAHALAWFLRFPHVGMWSFVAVVTGVVFVLYGSAMWRLVRFPVLFLLFAGTWPNRLIEPVNLKIQSLSAVGAAHVMAFIGYDVMREGNRIEIPGHIVEVADICSGYKKTVALVAFAFLYGFVMRTTNFRRAVLVLSAIPIAVAANVLRVAGLIAVTSAWGDKGLHKAHDPAEMIALGIAFVLFIWLGKVLGCRLPERI